MIDWLIRYPVVDLILTFDNFENAKMVAKKIAEAKSKGFLGQRKKLNYLIEVNVGQNRCGLEPGEDVVNFLEVMTKSEFIVNNLKFLGILAYQGWNQHIREISERRAAVIEKVGGKVRKTLDALKAREDLPEVEIVTGGGTGTFMFEAESGLFG